MRLAEFEVDQILAGRSKSRGLFIHSERLLGRAGNSLCNTGRQFFLHENLSDERL
jgi:hypothetical protein